MPSYFSARGQYKIFTYVIVNSVFKLTSCFNKSALNTFQMILDWQIFNLDFRDFKQWP